MSTRVVDIYIDKVVEQGPEKGSLRRYHAYRYEDGNYCVFKKVPGARKTEDRLVPGAASLEELQSYLSAGHKARFKAVGHAEQPTAVLCPTENDYAVVYRSI